MADGARRVNTTERTRAPAPSTTRAGSHHNEVARLRLDAAATLSHAVLWEADARGRVTYVTDSASGLLGYPRDAWLADHDFWASHVYPSDRDATTRLRAEAFDARHDYELSYRMVRADGSDIWVREAAIPAEGGAAAFRGLLQDVSDLKRAEHMLEVKDWTAEILANAESVAEAGAAGLEMVCLALGWDWGAQWMVDEGDHVLRCVATYGRQDADVTRFERASTDRTFESGVGLPGRVWQSGDPSWIDDLAADPNFPRTSTAAAVGLRSAFGFPIVLGPEVLGVVEFFSRERRERDEALLQVMTNLGRQIGQFSERKRIEEELRISEERYRSLAETLPAMVGMLTRDGRFSYVNRRWIDYTGMDLEELNAKGLEAITHPADIERVQSAWEKSRRSGGPIEIDYRVLGADGAYRWHFWRALPIRDVGGRIIRWLGATADIDDRKRAEEAQEFLADATALLASSLNYEAALRNLVGVAVPRIADIAAIDVFEADGSVRRLASRALDDKQRLLDEIHMRDWPVGGDRDLRVADVLRAGRSIFFADVSAWRERLAGRVSLSVAREFGAKSLMIVPLRARNETIGVLSLITAESNRRYATSDLAVAEELGRRAGIAVDNARLYQNAQRSADDLRTANAAKDEFLGLVSHELRTPITTIYGNAQVLRQRAQHLDGEARDLALADVEHEADRLYRIIDNMLVLARFETQPNLQTEPVLLQHAIARVVDVHQHRYPGRNVTIECPAGLPPVAAEPTYFEQVLTNLLNNAEKYSAAGSPIHVSATREDGEVAIRVLDRGRGIEPAEADLIFNAFFRSSRTSADASGAGIGLAVCKRLVEAQAGRVWARPREAGGTEVGFALGLELDPEA